MKVDRVQNQAIESPGVEIDPTRSYFGYLKALERCDREPTRYWIGVDLE